MFVYLYYIDCRYIFIIIVFHYTSAVDRKNTKKYSIFEYGCVFVFMCFCISTLFHFTISVDTINISISDNGFVFVFMCFCFCSSDSGFNLHKMLHESLRPKAPTKNPRVCYSRSKLKPKLPEIGGSEDRCCITKKSLLSYYPPISGYSGYSLSK